VVVSGQFFFLLSVWFPKKKNSFDKVVYDLLGEELYRDLESDFNHTPTASLDVSAHAFLTMQGSEDGAGCNRHDWDLDNTFLEVSEQFEQSCEIEDEPSITIPGKICHS
jgi:hypothetical protein